MKEWPPDQFTYGKYDLVLLPWATIRSTEAYHEHLLSLNIVGFCDAALVEVRPRPDDMAVMFEDDSGYQSWLHVPKDVWKEFMKKF